MTTHGRNGAFPPDPDADRLSAAWNDLVTETQPDVDDRDAELVEVVRSLHRGAPVVTPDARFKVNLKEHIMTSAARLATPSEINRRPLREIPTVRRTWAIPERPGTSSRLFPALIAAALLLASLGAAGYWSLNRDGSGGNIGGPAIMAPATPSTWTDETLFEITLPVDVVPAGELGSMDFHWHTIPANSVTSREADTCCPGVIVYFVLEGSAMIEGDGLIQVIRHDEAGAIEDYGAGEPANLGRGDVVIVRNDNTQTWTTGAAEAQLVIQSLATGASPGPPGSWDWQVNAYTYEIHSIVLPGGPYKLTLREVTVEDDTIFDLPENVVNQLALRKEGIAAVGIDLENVLKVTGVQEPVTLFVLTLSTTEGGGTTVAGMGTPTAATPEP